MQNDLCNNCKWYAGNRVCKAFPDTIPSSIWEDGDSHDTPVDGQENDIVFEERQEADDITDLLKKP